MRKSKSVESRKRKKERLGLPQKCVAHTSAGNPCQASPIKGGVVCWHHGGSAPQVQRKAAERLLYAADRLVAELLKIATSEQNPAVRLAAVRDALDRIGLGKNREVDLVIKPWAQNLEGLVIDLPEPTYDDVVDGEVVEPEPEPPLHVLPHDNVHPLRGRYGPVGGSTDGFSG